MKKTIHNKTLFFAQYLLQNVVKKHHEVKEENDNQPLLLNYDIGLADNHLYLELKPLSSISDEDAIEVGKIQSWWNTAKYKSIKSKEQKENFLIAHAKTDIQSSLTDIKVYDDDNTLNASTYDYLRSKGYALPFNGVSVETLIEWKWLKLKTN